MLLGGAPATAHEAQTSSSADATERPETALVRRPFALDPVLDPSVVTLAVAVGGASQIVIQSGALDVPVPGSLEDLPAIDRDAARHAYDNRRRPSESANSLLLATAMTTVMSSVATATRDDWREGWTDFALYAETLVVTFAASNVLKLAIRRPRPRAYAWWAERVAADDGSWDPNDPDYVQYQRDTEFALSFPSLHTSTVASLWATAAYVAFVRDYNPYEKWAIVAAGGVATAIVGWERVATLDHFPTDVIAGGLIGIALGVVVPHLHRSSELRIVPAASANGGSLTLCGPLAL